MNPFSSVCCVRPAYFAQATIAQHFQMWCPRLARSNTQQGVEAQGKRPKPLLALVLKQSYAQDRIDGVDDTKKQIGIEHRSQRRDSCNEDAPHVLKFVENSNNSENPKEAHEVEVDALAS